MGGQAAGRQPGEPGPAEDRDGRRPRRPVRPLRRLEGRGLRLRLRPRRPRASRGRGTVVVRPGRGRRRRRTTRRRHRRRHRRGGRGRAAAAVGSERGDERRLQRGGQHDRDAFERHVAGGVPSCTVVGPVAWMSWHAPGCSVPADTVAPVVRSWRPDPARPVAGQRDLVGGVGRPCRWPVAGGGGRWPRTGWAGWSASVGWRRRPGAWWCAVAGPSVPCDGRGGGAVGGGRRRRGPGARLLAPDEGEDPERPATAMTTTIPVTASAAAGGSSSRGPSLGPVGAGRRRRRPTAGAGPSGRASSKTIGASGSGNSSVPRTGTGGTTARPGAADCARSARTADRAAPPGGRRSVRGARACRGPGCSSATEWTVVAPGPAGDHGDHRPPRPAPRRRTRRPTSGLFNPESVHGGRAVPPGRRATAVARSRPQMAVTAVSPPSTVRWAPVMNEASADSRNRIGRAISSGVAIRRERGALLELLPEPGELEGGLRASGWPPPRDRRRSPGTPRRRSAGPATASRRAPRPSRRSRR